MNMCVLNFRSPFDYFPGDVNEILKSSVELAFLFSSVFIISSQQIKIGNKFNMVVFYTWPGLCCMGNFNFEEILFSFYL